jgi:hypothetical protein
MRMVFQGSYAAGKISTSFTNIKSIIYPFKMMTPVVLALSNGGGNIITFC